MKIFFPGFYTEAHRTEDKQLSLVEAFEGVGVECALTPHGCDLAFCGSIMVDEKTVEDLPVVHYNWDLYPHLVARGHDWARYVQKLRDCKHILVPNSGTAVRTLELAGRESSIVRAPVHLWDAPREFYGAPKPRSYALDVMRNYKWDANHGLAERACQQIGMPLIRTTTSRPWEEFKYLVANARVLLSCYVEASTGGLTLVEGYAHGVPSIVFNSPLNGASEYLPDRCTTFDSIDDLISKLQNPPEILPAEPCKSWVEDTYSEAIFTQRLKEEFEKCL